MKYQEYQLDNLLLALRYAALGWPVFPAWGVKDGRCLCAGGDDCRPGKHPFGRAVPRGHHDATTDPDLLRQWFITPFVTVGVNVGKAKSLVLDPDAKHGGLETLARLEAELGPLPHGPLAVTGVGGGSWPRPSSSAAGFFGCRRADFFRRNFFRRKFG